MLDTAGLTRASMHPPSGGWSTLRSFLIGPRGMFVAVMAVTYTATMTVFSVVAHDGLRTQMDDLGNMAQAVWAASRGDLLMMQSNDVAAPFRSRLGVHTNIIFWAFAPFYRFWPEPALLLFISSLACGVAGVGLYALARHRLGDTWATLIPPAAFWLNPMVHDANLFDFHVVTVIAALLVWMFWAFDSGRRRLGHLLLVLALLSQEHVALLGCLYGFFLATTGNRHEGTRIMIISAAYGVVMMGIVVPIVTRGETLSAIAGSHGRYSWVLERPLDAYRTAVQPERLRLPLYFLASGALVCLGQWRFLLLLLPSIASCLLSRISWMSRLTGTYYWVVDVAVIIAGCILAASQSPPGRPPRALVYLAAATVMFSYLLSPLPHSVVATVENHDSVPRAATLRAVVADVSPEASLVVQNNLGAHLAHRRLISSYPRRLEGAEYALFHLRHVGGPDTGFFPRPDFRLLTGMAPEKAIDAVRRLLESPTWSLVRQQDGFYLFRKVQGSPPATRVWTTFHQDSARLLDESQRAERARLPWATYVAGHFLWAALATALP